MKRRDWKQQRLSLRLPPRKVAALLLSVVLHCALAFLLASQSRDAGDSKPKSTKTKANSVKINVVERPKRDPKIRRQIIEAPLPETEAPEDEAFLGRQEHRAKQQSKLPPSQGPAGTDASRFAAQNPSAGSAQQTPSASDSIEPQSDKEGGSRKETSPQGNVGEPTPKQIKGILTDAQGTVPLGEGYATLLPQSTEIRSGHNDYIDDDSIPVGTVLDVNTTEYKYVGYFTAIRKQVEFAFYDPRSSLKAAPRIQQQLISQGRVSFQGVSTLQITVERSGLVTAAEIIDSSGDRELDEAWQRIINMAAPFPPLPRHFEEEKLIFNYSLYYDFVIQDSQRVRRFHF